MRRSSAFLRRRPSTPCPWMCCAPLSPRSALYDPEEKNNDHDANVRKAIRLTSQMAMIVAAYDRIRKGKPLVEPDRYALACGELPAHADWRSPEQDRGTGARHRADPACRPRAECLDLRRARGRRNSERHALGRYGRDRRAEGAAAWRRQRGRIPDSRGDRSQPAPIRSTTSKACWRRRRRSRASGIACITPKIRAPRTCARCRETSAIPAARPSGSTISHKIEEFVKAEKKLNANVDFYSASTYHTLGIDLDLFTPIFAVSRVAGWTAHVIEQLDDNRLIRPRADYIGPKHPAPYIPIEQR